MRKMLVAALLAAMLAPVMASAAQAAEINVFTPPLVRESGLPKVVEAFEKKTGVKVNLSTHSMGSAIRDIRSGPVAPDVIFLLNNEMGTLAISRDVKGPHINVGRVYMGMGVLNWLMVPIRRPAPAVAAAPDGAGQQVDWASILYHGDRRLGRDLRRRGDRRRRLTARR